MFQLRTLRPRESQALAQSLLTQPGPELSLSYSAGAVTQSQAGVFGVAEVCAIIDFSVLFLLFGTAWTNLDLSKRSSHSKGELGQRMGPFKTSCHGDYYLFLLCEIYMDEGGPALASPLLLH